MKQSLDTTDRDWEELCRRCEAAEKTVEILKRKVQQMYQVGPQTGIYRQLENAQRRQDRRLQQQHRLEQEAARELAVAKQRMECALDGGKLAIWEWDLTTDQLYFDDRWYQIVQRKPESVRNQPQYWLNLVHPEDLPRLNTYLFQLMAGNVTVFEDEFRLKNGEGKYLWLLMRAQALGGEEGVLNRLVGTILEITERKEAELAIRQSEAHARALFDYSIDAICRLENGVIKDCNPAAPAVFGFESVEDLVGVSVLDFSPEYQSDGMLSLEKVTEVIERLQAEKSIRFEWTHCRPDGSLYEVDVCLFAVETGAETYHYSFVRDISHRKELERQLAQAQSLESIGQLAAGVAHEINTPMQCVFSNVEYLEQAMGKLFRQLELYRGMKGMEGLPDQVIRQLALAEGVCRIDRVKTNVMEAVHDSVQGSKRVIEVVRAMRTISHPGTEKVPTGLNQLVEDACIVSRNRWKVIAAMELDLDVELQEVPVYASRISQILLNVIVNAVDAIVERQIDQPELEGRIIVRTRRRTDWAVLEIQDNGMGMKNEIKGRVFDPFFTTKEVGKGTGQGLSIAYDVVAEHGGKIDIDSVYGEGTTFRIWLPLELARPIPVRDAMGYQI